MPPATTKKQQDPMNLEELFRVLTESGAPAEAKVQTLQTLYTVAHHPRMKGELMKRPDVLRAIGMTLVQRSEAFYKGRWVALAIIGELCRRESRGDVADVVDRNGLAKDFVAFYARVNWFPGTLKDISQEEDEHGDQVSEIAADLLASFPTAQKEPANVSAGEEQMGEGLVWTKEQRDRSKDLMYIDPTEPRQLEILPFVVRASNRECSNCREKSEKPLSRCVQCKAVFYCSATCQKAAWSAMHKTVCSGWKAKDPAAFSVLFYETRAYLYDNRPESLQNMKYYDYFINYSPTYRM